MKKITALTLLAAAAGIVLASCGPTDGSSDNTSANPPAPTSSSVESPASSSEEPPVSSSEEPPVSSSEEPPVSSSEEPAVTVTSIAAVYNGEAINYGAAINPEDVVVTAYYSDGSDHTVTGFVLDYNSQTAEAQMTVTVTYEGQSTTFTVGINKVALSIRANYTGSDIKYGGTITKSKVEVYQVFSDNSEEKVGTSNYDITYDSKRRSGTYNDGVVTGKGTIAGFTTNFSFTIARSTLPTASADLEPEIVRMVKIANPSLEDPEYQVDYKYNSNNGAVYFLVSNYQTEKTNLIDINKEVAAWMDANATASSNPYIDEAGGAYGEYFITATGVEMYVYNTAVDGVNNLQIGIFHSSKVAGWPAETIAEKIAAIDSTTTTVIPEVSGVMTSEIDESNVARIGVYLLIMSMNEGVANPTEGYKETLMNAGWTCKEGAIKFTGASYTFVSPDKIIVLEIAYNAAANQFAFAFYKNDLGFPTATVKQVMTILGSENDPVVPADSDFAKFYTDTTYWASYGIFNIYTPGTEADIAKYEQAWKDAGWTLVNAFGYYFYNTVAVSPDGKVCVEYDYYDGGLIDMYYRAFDEDLAWNAAAVAEIVSLLVPEGSTTTVPAFGGSNHFRFTFNSNYGVGLIYCETEDPAAAIANYALVLESNSWVEAEPESGSRVFISPNADLKMTVVNNTTFVGLQLQPYVAPAATWPGEALAAAIPDGVRDTIPAYEGEEVTKYQFDGTTTANPAVMMYTSDIAVTAAGYVDVCEKAGYTNDAALAEDYGLDYVLVSPNEDITIYIYSFETDGIVTAEFEFNPVLSLATLTAFLTAKGYATTGAETFLNALSEGARYQEGHDSYYDLDYLYITLDESFLDAAKAFAESTGVPFQASYSDETHFTYIDMSDYREIDIVVEDGEIGITIWEGY